MHDHEKWDWNIGRKQIADIGKWKENFKWVEEPCASPDGEKVAAVVKTEDMEFSVCENGDAWESTFDKVWYLRFSPDNRLTGLVSDMGEWTLAVDGAPWESRFEFAWDTQFSQDGAVISISGQKGRKYHAVVNDASWEQGFDQMTNLTLSPDGSRTAAVVQTEAFGETDILKFQEGCFSVAVDGQPWDKNFVNVWEMVFSPDHEHVAAEVRTSLYDYTIAVDGVPWSQNFTSVWKPLFSQDGSVTAPVRIKGAWNLAKNGISLWDRSFVQLWHHQHSADGKKLAAIVAPEFGKWTVAVDGVPWSHTFGELVTDLAFSPEGTRAACVGKADGKWMICVDGQPWTRSFDMAWQPVFSPNNAHVAAKVEKNGRYTIIIDDRPLKQDFEAAWNPVFSPDGEKILIRGIEGKRDEAVYSRQILALTDI